MGKAIFRAWHSLENRMYVVVELNRGIPTILASEISNKIVTPQEAKLLDVMEFTGRFDVNKTPIFDGDILEADGGAIALVRWVSTDDYVGWALVAKNQQDGAYKWNAGWRVLGNWYKPPDMITETDLARWKC